MKATERAETRELHLAIDLTAVLPGGENGGARNFVVNLLEGLVEACPHWTFLLLTRQLNHDFLADLERSNVSRSLTDGEQAAPETRRPGRFRQLFRRLPLALRRRLYGPLDRLTGRLAASESVSELDLIFCPFTAPFYCKSGLACVSFIHDLQYQEYPQFFSADERAERHRHLELASHRCDRLIVASQFVAGTLQKGFEIPPDRIRVIPIRPKRRRPSNRAEAVQRLLAMDLHPGKYFIYPANYWPHKNHRILLTAFSIFCQQEEHPPKLVLTGHPFEGGPDLQAEARELGLQGQVIQTGYVEDSLLTDLLARALALVYPSLFEGFGIPLIEAMELGVPVIAGNRTAIPETCDGAALLVDPRKPLEISAAMARVWRDQSLRSRLREAGLARLERLGARELMVEEFRRAFLEVVKTA